MRGWRSLVVLCAISLLATHALTGCGRGAAGDGAEAAANPLAGEWVDLAGGRIKFTEDVFYTNADDESLPHYRYTITSDTRMRLTPLVVKNGVESPDTENTRVETYELKGDTLELESHWDRLYRPDSAALKEAQAARQSDVTGQANTAEAKVELDGCSTVRSTYVAAFEAWFEMMYPDRGGYGYSIGQYIKIRKLDLDWKFSTLKAKLGTGYATAAYNYEMGITPDEDDAAEKSKILGWVKAGVCPSGGSYSTRWDLREASPLQIECSVHGEGQ